MLSIRLQPRGRKKQRTYRIVVDEKRSKLTGKVVEDLGWLNPLAGDYEVNQERAKYWVGIGAQPSDTIHNLFVKEGIISGPKRAVHSKSKKTAEESTSPEDGETQGEAPKVEGEESGEQELAESVEAPAESTPAETDETSSTEADEEVSVEEPKEEVEKKDETPEEDKKESESEEKQEEDESK